MKRILALILALVMTMALVACGGDKAYKCPDVRIAFVRAVLSVLLFRAPELKHKSTLLSINEH